MMRHQLISFVCFSIACLAGASLHLLAQYQVNPMVNNSVNTRLYGGGTSGSVRYAGVNPEIRSRTSVAMQSELRHAYWKSGATPSDVRMGYAALGPMTEGGPISYINYKPSYLSNSKAAPPPAGGSAAYSTMGSIKYSSPAAAPSAALVSSKSLDALLAPPKAASPSLTHTAKPAPAPIPNTIHYTR